MKKHHDSHLLADRAEQRASDPHAWAERVERALVFKLIAPAIATVVAAVAVVSTWALWQERDAMIERLDALELDQRQEDAVDRMRERANN